MVESLFSEEDDFFVRFEPDLLLLSFLCVTVVSVVVLLDLLVTVVVRRSSFDSSLGRLA